MPILKSRSSVNDPWKVVGVGNSSPQEIETHNTSPLAHADIRKLVENAIQNPTVPGTDGQFAVSDGKGGIRFITLTNRAEVGA